MKYLILIISLFLCGCASTKYYPEHIYIAEYTDNMLKYINTNNTNNSNDIANLNEANKNWNMYLKARANQVNKEN